MNQENYPAMQLLAEKKVVALKERQHNPDALHYIVHNMQYSIKALLHVQRSRKMGPIIKTKKKKTAKERAPEITKILELGFNFLNGNYKHVQGFKGKHGHNEQTSWKSQKRNISYKKVLIKKY